MSATRTNNGEWAWSWDLDSADAPISVETMETAVYFPQWMRDLGLCTDHVRIIDALLAHTGEMTMAMTLTKIVEESGLPLFVVRAGIDFLRREGLITISRPDDHLPTVYDLRPLLSKRPEPGPTKEMIRACRLARQAGPQ